jgi:hypothetical protein
MSSGGRSGGAALLGRAKSAGRERRSGGEERQGERRRRHSHESQESDDSRANHHNIRHRHRRALSQGTDLDAAAVRCALGRGGFVYKALLGSGGRRIRPEILQRVRLQVGCAYFWCTGCKWVVRTGGGLCVLLRLRQSEATPAHLQKYTDCEALKTAQRVVTDGPKHEVPGQAAAARRCMRMEPPCPELQR